MRNTVLCVALVTNLQKDIVALEKVQTKGYSREQNTWVETDFKKKKQ